MDGGRRMMTSGLSTHREEESVESYRLMTDSAINHSLISYLKLSDIQRLLIIKSVGQDCTNSLPLYKERVFSQ
jgi:hypothetical protein